MALAQYDFVGIKHVSGEKDGKPYSFDQGCFIGEWTEREVNGNNAKGLSAIVPSIPEQYKDVLNVEHLGWRVELDTYFAKGRINIGYARLISEPKKK